MSRLNLTWGILSDGVLHPSDSPFRQQKTRWFFAATAALIAAAIAEICLLYAGSADGLTRAHLWLHPPILLLAVTFMVFVICYLGSGRVWLPLSVFAAYYLGAKIGFALTWKPEPVSVLWPPNSILLAAMLLTPRRIWWVLLLAALPAHWLVQIQSDVPPRMIFCWFVSNSCEALIGAGLIRYVISGPVQFDRLNTVGIFCLFGAFLGPFLSSFLDAGFVTLNHWGVGSYWDIWRIRFTSNVLAALTISPFIVTWARDEIAFFNGISGRRLLEGCCLFLGLSLISVVFFNKGSSNYDTAFICAPLPFLLWAAVRFGSRGSTAAVAALSLVAIWGAAHGHGPFSEGSARENALYVQLFLIFMSVPFLFLAALTEERNKVEETLRERDERIGLAAETANLALWTIDFARRESWMSAKGRELFGFGPDERLSREALLARVHPEDRKMVDNAIERARANSQTFEIEYRIAHPKGETRSLIARGRYLHDDRGQLNELIGVAIDVTPQVNANIEIRLQREEMARLNRMAAMGALTASLAHELNQPLSAIVSNASAGQRFIDKGQLEPAVLGEILNDVEADGRRANDIIQSVRNAIREGPPIRGQVNLNDLVKAVMHMVQPDSAVHLCEVQTSLAEELPAIDGDPVQIQQVLINLLSNAFDAMRNTPVDCRKVQIATEYNGDGAVHVSVRDYGVGLLDEARKRLFEHFFTTKEEGLGLGLAIARSIIEAHGGRIRAENADGGGARFHFDLPTSKGILR